MQWITLITHIQTEHLAFFPSIIRPISFCTSCKKSFTWLFIATCVCSVYIVCILQNRFDTMQMKWTVTVSYLLVLCIFFLHACLLLNLWWSISKCVDKVYNLIDWSGRYHLKGSKMTTVTMSREPLSMGYISK